MIDDRTPRETIAAAVRTLGNWAVEEDKDEQIIRVVPAPPGSR